MATTKMTSALRFGSAISLGVTKASQATTPIIGFGLTTLDSTGAGWWWRGRI